MKFDVIIFDLDGTLLDTLADLASAMNTVLNKAGYPAYPESAYKMFVGGGVEELGAMVLPPHARTKENIHSCVRQMLEIYRKNWAIKTRPYPGIPEMLSELSELGVKLAVLSNKLHDFVIEMVHFYFPEAPFSTILGANERFPIKPDPMGALMIARENGVKPEKCLVLGDSGSDMVTARRAGMAAWGALWGFRSRAELIESGANHLFESADKIINFFKF
jgi:phosphoglycolate phosphatase